VLSTAIEVRQGHFDATDASNTTTPDRTGIRSPVNTDGVRLDFEGISGTAGERQEAAGSRQETADSRSERGARTNAWGDDSRSGESVERKAGVDNRDGEASTLSSEEGGIVVSGGSVEVYILSHPSRSLSTPLQYLYVTTV
jgi:hypothetical protein